MCSKQTWNLVCTFSIKHRETCIRYDPQIVGPTELIGAQTLQWCLLQACTEHDATSSESTLTWQGAKKTAPVVCFKLLVFELRWTTAEICTLAAPTMPPQPAWRSFFERGGVTSPSDAGSISGTCIYVYIYTHTYIYIYVYIYMYMYTQYISVLLIHLIFRFCL